MMTSTIKVKVVRRPSLKLKVLPRFPASVTAAGPIVLNQTGGNYAFSFNPSQISSVPASALPNPTASTLGGVESIAAVSHNWINSISTSGVPSLSQPAFTDISGQATLAQLPTLGANTVLGSIAGGTPIALSKTQNTTLVNTFTTALSGAVPSPGSVTNKFLRDDGTWQLPPGSGTVTNIATAGLATGGAITTTGTITVTAAVKSDQTTATSTAVAVVPAVQQNHPSAVKAWATFVGSTGVIADSYGITSITRNGTGDYTILFSTAFANTGYGVTGMAQAAGVANAQGIVNYASTASGPGAAPTLKSTTQVRIATSTSSTGALTDFFTTTVMVVGTQ